MTALRRIAGLVVLLLAAAGPCVALTVAPEIAHDLALGENDAKVQAINALTSTGGADALAVLQALSDGEVQTAGEQVLWIKDGKATDLATGKDVTPLPEARDDVVLNNRVRRELATAIAALKLTSPERDVRLAAAKELQSGADEAMLPAIERALANEPDAGIKALLTLTRATIQLSSGDKPQRIAAIRALAESRDPKTKMLLLPLVEKKGTEFAEADAEVRTEAEASLRAIESRLSTGEIVDPLNGRKDIERRVLRTVSPSSFAEDPLRLVRALRFVSQLGFDLDESTLTQMRAEAKAVRLVSGERVGGGLAADGMGELSKLLLGREPGRALRLARDTVDLPPLGDEVIGKIAPDQAGRSGDDCS